MSKEKIVNRRRFLGFTGKALLGGSAALVLPQVACSKNTQVTGRRPNIVLIITDDQGFGDLGCHGNDKIKTPNLDRLAKQSVEFTQFYVCPVCAPTRACLMTGRYNFRTGVVDTYLGRAMMYSDEVTMAEMFSADGYHTGIFGKWHLGDNYPMRPTDQGFQESLVHKGGGIGQPSDPPGNKYFDPILQYNNEAKRYKGYCTDIFTDAAIQFIEMNRDKPFFVYLSTNAPHTPLQIGDHYVAPYKSMGLDDTTARVYGMVTNIDDNVGRLLDKLKELNIEDNTIVIFMTDNGPQISRRQSDCYNAGLHGSKGTVYEGGIRVPFFIRLPGVFEAGKKIGFVAAHIDILPTLLDICDVKKSEDVSIDGVSLLPLLVIENVELPNRTLYFQWHRGDEPQLYRSFAARSQRYKLVHPVGAGTQSSGSYLEKILANPELELYDMVADPGEKKNIAAEHPDVVAQMRKDYENWFSDVSSTRGYAPPRIPLGTQFENPVILTRQDWRGARGWSDKDLGYWEIRVTRTSKYAITLRFPVTKIPGEAHFRLGGVHLSQPLEKGISSCIFDSVHLESKEGRLEAWLRLQGESVGVSYVDVWHSQ